ncbi:MAG: hypothetical protein HY952_08335, partial [Elusimicrobia bacterium]|nr:hypothetical protein [Elusimicrobiota bacterium]
TATGVLYPAMSGADNTKVAKAGDTMTGQLTLAGSTLTVAGNAFSVGGSTLAVEGGNVGVGIAAPDTRLELAGALAVNSGGVKYYRSLAHYTGGGTFTGTLKIAMPKFWSGTMMRIRIDGYDYDPATGHWEVLVSGYNYAPSGPWYNYSAEIRGKAPFSQVRLASDGAKNVLLLGNLSTDWRYPKVAVSELVAGNAERDGWGSGWGISVISSEAGIVDVVTPAPLLRTVGSFLVSGSTNAALSGTVDRGMVVTAGGRVGIAAASPAAALDAAADGAAVSDFVQIWRKSDGVIVGSMSATGVLMAAKLIGDGSGITGLPGGDNLGNHTATQALGMAGFAISGVSTITMQNGSIAIVQPGGTGSNSLYGISMGYGAADNYRNGIGIGRDASNNYSTGVGVGYAAYGNHDYGVGIGYNAHNNYNSGVGIGFNSSDNYDYGVGIGWWTYVNYNYGIGVGWGAASNLNSGVGIGYGAANNNDSGVGIGANARQNHHSGVGIGDGAYQNDTSGVGVGNNARNNYSSGVGVGTGANGNYSSGVGIGSGAVGNSGYGVGIGASALSNSAYGVGIGAYAQSNDTYGVGIGAYSQNNYAYGTGVGAYTSSKSSSVALGYYARANSVDSVALGAGAATNAQRSVCIGAYCVNNAVDTAKIREGYTLKVDSISVSAALPQLTVSTNVYIVGYSSAARYYGDGSGLTGISGGSAGPSIDVSTINASAATPYGGVNITTNVFITGGARLARAVVQAADSGITLTAADFGKIITINSASAQTVSLPSVSAADIGATVRVVKLGAGQVTIQAAASTYIADSTSGGTVYNSEVSPQYGAITLCLVTATQWMILGGDGVWTTT